MQKAVYLFNLFINMDFNLVNIIITLELSCFFYIIIYFNSNINDLAQFLCKELFWFRFLRNSSFYKHTSKLHSYNLLSSELYTIKKCT